MNTNLARISNTRIRFTRYFNNRTLRFVIALFAVAIVCAFAAIPPQADAAGTLTYTALGDSIAFGAFAPIGQGYVPRYKSYIQSVTGTYVSTLNLGIPGWTSADLHGATSGRPLFQLSILSSQIVTWNIGGNDLNAARDSYKARTCGGADNQDCLRAAVNSFKANWSGILTDLFTLRHGRPTVLRTMTIYNPFVTRDIDADSWQDDGGLKDFVVLKLYLDAVNDYIKQTSALRGVKVALVYEVFNGAAGNEDPISKGFISFDGFHPSGSGHAKIAELLAGLGPSPIVP